jgi:hypothetical protein
MNQAVDTEPTLKDDENFKSAKTFLVINMILLCVALLIAVIGGFYIFIMAGKKTGDSTVKISPTKVNIYLGSLALFTAGAVAMGIVAWLNLKKLESDNPDITRAVVHVGQIFSLGIALVFLAVIFGIIRLTLKNKNVQVAKLTEDEKAAVVKFEQEQATKDAADELRDAEEVLYKMKQNPLLTDDEAKMELFKEKISKSTAETLKPLKDQYEKSVKQVKKLSSSLDDIDEDKLSSEDKGKLASDRVAVEEKKKELAKIQETIKERAEVAKSAKSTKKSTSSE